MTATLNKNHNHDDVISFFGLRYGIDNDLLQDY